MWHPLYSSFLFLKNAADWLSFTMHTQYDENIIQNSALKSRLDNNFGMHVVGKIVKLEKFMLEHSF